MLCLIALKAKTTLSNLKKEIKIYPQVLFNAKVKSNNKNKYKEDAEILKKIEEIEEEFKENGRVLIRASGTENLIRVMIEGEDKDYIEEKAKELAHLIEKKLN